MNPYHVLGVSPNASDEEVTRAYKTLAKRFHPDLNPDDPAAADRMGAINRAYDDVKAMRQRGEAEYSSASYRSGVSDAYDPFETMRSAYRYRYYSRGVRRSPVWIILSVMTMIFFVRLVLSILFGGYASYYYPYDPAVPSAGSTAQTYGYYDTIP